MRKKYRNLLILILVLLTGGLIVSTRDSLFSRTECMTDLNNDNVVDSLDLIEFRKYFGHNLKEAARFDFNGDSAVNTLDMNMLMSSMGKSCK